jgi:hypothetical protein
MSVRTQIDRLNAIKSRIRTNLAAQGITVPADTMLEEMASMILSVAGEDGYTPQRGTDYWTDADQEAIVQQVIAALGTPVFGRVDADNNIILTGELMDGTYSVKYEDAEGTLTEVGTIEVGGDPGMGDSGSIQVTWANGVKLDKNTGAEGAGASYAASQHIELVDGYTYTFNQIDNGHGNTYGGATICYYDASGNYIGYETLWDATSGVFSVALTPISGAKTFRVRLYCGETQVTKYHTLTYTKNV